jgi:two-component system, response regulator PdtaR
MCAEVVVLVVEDEDLVRSLAVDALEEAGYATLEAQNADQAIQLLESHPEVRLVFTDVQMPGVMDGAKLAAAVRERWPPLRIIVTSARPKPELIEDAAFLPKPYDSLNCPDTWGACWNGAKRLPRKFQ